MLLLEAIVYQTKIPLPCVGFLIMSCWLGRFQEYFRTTQAVGIPLGFPPELYNKIQKKQARTELDISSLLASFPFARRYCTGAGRNKAFVLLTNCEPCEIQYYRQDVPSGVMCDGSNCWLSDWMWNLLHRLFWIWSKLFI